MKASGRSPGFLQITAQDLRPRSKAILPAKGFRICCLGKRVSTREKRKGWSLPAQTVEKAPYQSRD